MGIPTTGTRLDAQTQFFEQIRETYKDKVQLVFPKECVRRLFHDYARNEIVKEFLASDCDVLWFLDSDILPSGNVLDLVTEHYEKWTVAGGVYPIWMADEADNRSQKVFFTAYTANDTGGYHAAPVPRKGTEYVDGLATGCLFIKRSLLEMMKPPYFSFTYNEETRGMIAGEDLSFCKVVNQMGYKFFTDYSIVCGHYKTVNLLDVSNYAIEMSNYKIKAYDAEVRPKVEKLGAALQRLKAGTTKTGLIIPGKKPLVTP